MLIDTTDPLHSLELINRIQCLGVAYHFEKEIEKILLKIYETNVGYDDLYAVALHFRLLRQQRYHISSDVFSKFLDKKREFISCLNNDVKALLSLYEASHLSMPGEEILDKALEFSKIQLKTLASNMDPYLSEMVSSSLAIPLVRRGNRLKAKHYLSIFEKESICNETLLNFAKLDFNILQATHQEEARSLSIWWKDLNLTKSLPFTRDRLIEGYFWTLLVYFEPHYSRARLMMTKIFSLISILDDIYDAYGTVEELQLLTDVIESWQLENVGKLPQYMQHEFLASYSNFKEFENKLEQEQYSFRVHYLKEEEKKMAKAYFQEAIWANDGYVPKLKDYLGVSIITAGYGYLACASYIGMQDEISKEFFDWVTSMPQIIKSANFITRLANDIGSNEFEQKRKHVASAVQCYVMEYRCSNEEARNKLMEMVEEEWKILNREFMFSKKNIPIHLLWTIINLTNAIEFVYKDAQDNYTESTKSMKDNIIDVLIEPVQIHMDVKVINRGDFEGRRTSKRKLDSKLLKKGLVIVSKCQCCYHFENINHVFINGPIAIKVWNYFDNIFKVMVDGYYASFTTKIRDWIIPIKEHIRNIIPVFICWYLWASRNDSKHNNIRMDAMNIISKVKNKVIQLYNANLIKPISFKNHYNAATALGLVFSNRTIQSREKLIYWKRPVIGYFKLNTDSSYNSDTAGCGGIIRDHNGKIVVAFAGPSSGTNVITAEIDSLNFGVKLCLSLGYINIWVEVDALLLFQYINGNAVADALAKMGIRPYVEFWEFVFFAGLAGHWLFFSWVLGYETNAISIPMVNPLFLELRARFVQGTFRGFLSGQGDVSGNFTAWMMAGGLDELISIEANVSFVLGKIY
ncbi:hypothetical protein KFK09_017170 [Dendrobium nobile]|uniref:Uncharacterized protein n=1 Tax=Dendrobium nobile TaxID=94219 RepID=A0A8T3B0B3_DENNO|nr:hypothetical protein KFK09_017170 [Dendrobium nobile]